MHNIKTKKISTMILKLDLSKAYVQANWLYLRLILYHLGFGVHFLNWVMSCLTLVSFTILINGLTFEFFKPSRGLRHGFPLYPLLFLIVVEGLARLLWIQEELVL
jgi:hypothetical protein